MYFWGQVWKRVWILEASSKMGVESDIFWSEIKWGQDLENRAANSNKNSQGYPLPSEYISPHKELRPPKNTGSYFSLNLWFIHTLSFYRIKSTDAWKW